MVEGIHREICDSQAMKIMKESGEEKRKLIAEKDNASVFDNNLEGSK
jgi:hypothetical protein